MDNPYWSTEGQTHHIDLNTVRGLCFQLYNLVEASKPVAEQHVHGEQEAGHSLTLADSPMLALHRDLTDKQASQILLQLALMVRTFDDIISESDSAEAYAKHAATTSGEDRIGNLSGDQRFDLREACNKIIHAIEIRPLYETVDRPFDGAEGNEADDVHYLTGEIELKGRRGKEKWEATLYAQEFIEVVLERIAFQKG